jgi:hypothetical protein
MIFRIDSQASEAPMPKRDSFVIWAFGPAHVIRGQKQCFKKYDIESLVGTIYLPNRDL